MFLLNHLTMLDYSEIQDRVSGHYFPPSESDKKEMKRAKDAERVDSELVSMLSSILK